MEKLQQFIAQHEANVFTLGPLEEQEIEEAESKLGHRLPEELRAYLQRYGALSFGSVEFYGLGMKPSSHLHLVQRTLEFREEDGFPRDAVLLEAIGDGHYAVCRADGLVVEWSFPTYIAEGKQLASSPEEYMIERLQEA